MKQIHFCFWKPARAFSSYCREVPSRRCFSAPSSLWFYEFSKDVLHMTEINIIWEGIYDIVSYFTTYLVRANKYLKLIIIYRKSKIIETFVCAAESYWYQGSLFEKQSKFFCQYIQQVCSTSRKNPKMIACLILHRGDAIKKTFLSNGFGFRRWDQQMPQEFTRRRCLWSASDVHMECVLPFDNNQ